MEGKYDIVQLDWIYTSRMLQEIIILNRSEEVETDIEASIECEAHNVETEKVEVETNYTFPPEVLNDLRVEGHCPCHEVYPPHHKAGPIQRLGLHHDHSHEGLGGVYPRRSGICGDGDMAGLDGADGDREVALVLHADVRDLVENAGVIQLERDSHLIFISE